MVAYHIARLTTMLQRLRWADQRICHDRLAAKMERVLRRLSPCEVRVQYTDH